MTPRYKLRTLLVLLAVLPPLLWIGWMKYEAWKSEQDRRRAAAAAARQFVLPQQQLTHAQMVLTAAQYVQAMIAENEARAAAQAEAEQPAREAALEAREAALEAKLQAALQVVQEDRERAVDATRAERLQRAGYLPFPAVPRIQSQPKAPPAAPIEP